MDNLVHLCKHHHRLLHEGGYQMIHETSGALSFFTPKGNRISEFPQPVTSDKSLETINQQARLDINPETAVPNWQGEVMDYDLAVSGMYALAHCDVGGTGKNHTGANPGPEIHQFAKGEVAD